jgi:hypothetical protein
MKKRKNIINLGLFFILFLATIYILWQNKKGTSELSPDAFAIQDTASLSKIFITDLQGESVTLTKNNDTWFINGEYPVNKTRIELLLDVVRRMEIKHPTPANARENVIKDMASNAIKVEFYGKKKKPLKIIYVGGPTQDNLGTYMALESENKEPYVIHLPGFNGYLSEGYFFTDISEWRSKIVFNYQAENIEEIRLDYDGQGDSSYFIRVLSPNTFEVRDLKSNELIAHDPQKVKAYLQGFSKLYFMAIDTDTKGYKRDSILNSKPAITIQVKTKQSEKSLELYYRPTDIRTRVELFPGADKEYFLGLLSDRKDDLLILQRLILDQIMWKTEDFKTEK